MKKITLILLLSCIIYSCSNKKNIPDVSKIKVELNVERFEKDFFAMDTTQLDQALQQLFNKYPTFSIDFFQNILGSSPQPDTMMQNVKLFINAYKNIYAESNTTFADFANTTKNIKQGFQFVKYYFPKYDLPTTLVTYIGPWDAIFMVSNRTSGSGVMRDGKLMGIGLHLALGKNFSVYKEGGIRELYPEFVSKRFDKIYLPVDALKIIVDDLYPYRSAGKPLVQQMIEAGKRLYLLNAFLPNTHDTLKTGYTQKQLEGCFKNEANIWSFFVTNDLLFTNEVAIIKDYMNDAPNTAALGEESPGFIGQFVGWQIVKKWMSKNEKATLQQLMSKSPKEIFEESKYKP